MKHGGSERFTKHGLGTAPVKLVDSLTAPDPVEWSIDQGCGHCWTWELRSGGPDSGGMEWYDEVQV